MERTEHPKPQFERENWLNLNGEWEFEFDFGNSGEERGQYREDAVFHQKINVPFCPESVLSGIGYTDFMTSVWYRRKINLKKELLSQRIFLHFGAVDHFATVYINGQKCGTHKGGYVSFKVDVSPYVREGENIITVHAMDDIRDRLVARGKQAETYYSEQCVYTRTTGDMADCMVGIRSENIYRKGKILSRYSIGNADNRCGDKRPGRIFCGILF